MAENLSERGFIGEVVKAEILHFVQDDAPGRERLLRQRFFATLRVIERTITLGTPSYFTNLNPFSGSSLSAVLERAEASEGPQ